MYRCKHLYIPVDNSAHSNRAAQWGIALAKAFGARITGAHAYAAKLHDRRFKQMEYTLPEKYQEERELEKQRKVHDSLIGMGLRLISESYLDVLERDCRKAGVKFERRMRDGKNWEMIVRDAAELDCDLIVLGALGMGAVKRSVLGSVCERVVRRTRKDVLVIKDASPLSEQTGPILAAVDGSPQSFAGVQIALHLARLTGRRAAAVAVYDPYLHYAVFKGLAGVLSKQAAKVFRFQEQEKLHEDIIDTGLAKIYQSHLDVAAELARRAGLPLELHLKAGKAFEAICATALELRPSLLVMGRIGVHSDEDMDIGSNTENLLRLSQSNVLLTSRKHVPSIDIEAEASMVWTEEAQRRFQRVPESVRGVARTAVHRHAMERGHSIVTNSIIDECMKLMMPKMCRELEGVAAELAQKVVAARGTVYICKACGKASSQSSRPKICTVCKAGPESFEAIRSRDIEAIARREGGVVEESAFDGVKLNWTKEARKEFDRIEAGHAKSRIQAEIEKTARVKGLSVVTRELVTRFAGKAGAAARVTPHVSAGNELPSPLPMPKRWRKAAPASTQPQASAFEWTQEALSRLARVPAGFMRERTRRAIEEYAGGKGKKAVDLDTAEAGLAEARKTMQEMIGT